MPTTLIDPKGCWQVILVGIPVLAVSVVTNPTRANHPFALHSGFPRAS